MVRSLTLIAALGAVTLFAAPAQAGIVILKNGKVIVGDIDEKKETEDHVLVVFKKGGDETKGRGETKVPRHTIRWYDRESDVPTAAYWEKHENDKIESKWVPFRERWKIAKDVKDEAPELASKDPQDLATKGLAKGKTAAKTAKTKAAKTAKTGKTSKTGGAAAGGCKQSCSLQPARRSGNLLWFGALLLGLLGLRRRS